MYIGDLKDKIEEHRNLYLEKEQNIRELKELATTTRNGIIFQKVVGGYSEANVELLGEAITLLKKCLSGSCTDSKEDLLVDLDKVVKPSLKDCTCIIGVKDVQDTESVNGWTRYTVLEVYADHFYCDKYVAERSGCLEAEIDKLCNAQMALEQELALLGIEVEIEVEEV